MRVLTKIENLEQKYAIALMVYADELETIAVELTYNLGVTQHSKGNGYSQVAIGTDDVYKSAEIVNLITEELGGKITQPPSLDSQMTSKIISFLDPDGRQIVRLTILLISTDRDEIPVSEIPNGKMIHTKSQEEEAYLD
ncbi:lactoylglutathione lyase GLX1-like [Cucumis melo]|uniref:Lactoylglutathione lyase GLX1-like n=1 Tax=Cucumis melo TaxID=3656 RepID=A0A1S4DU46_CUCME|nr:lactoylglutathione lyase GLX1-like [Cucumis melo]